MRNGRLLAIGLLGVTSWLTLPAAQAATTNLHADLSGSEEVPGPGAPDGKGTADLVVDDVARTVCYEFRYEGIQKPNLAHIHHGRQGVAGPVVLDFDIEKNGDKGCVSTSESVINSIRDDAQFHYVNIHTKDFPKGAIRGQLDRM